MQRWLHPFHELYRPLRRLRDGVPGRSRHRLLQDARCSGGADLDCVPARTRPAAFRRRNEGPATAAVNTAPLLELVAATVEKDGRRVLDGVTLTIDAGEH